MRISSAELEDGGTYYCHANNSLGQATQEVTLQVGAQYKYYSTSTMLNACSVFSIAGSETL